MAMLKKQRKAGTIWLRTNYIPLAVSKSRKRCFNRAHFRFRLINMSLPATWYGISKQPAQQNEKLIGTNSTLITNASYHRAYTGYILFPAHRIWSGKLFNSFQ